MPLENDFTEDETNRQDFVDGSIHALLETLAGKKLDWDISIIGQVRDVISNIFVFENIMPEMEFYPYREESEINF